MITVHQIRRLSANPKNLARDSTVHSPFTTRALPAGPHRTPLPSEGGPSTTSELDSTRRPKPESDPVPPLDLITSGVRDNQSVQQYSRTTRTLDDTDTGSMDLADCFGVQNPLYKSPTTVAAQNNQSNPTGNEAEFVNCNQFPDQQKSSQRGSPHPDEFMSTLFLVENQDKSGEHRPVINLKALNQFLPKETFKMESLNTVRSLLRPGDFMMKMDLKDAYYVVPIYPHHRKYLRFQFERVTYEFQCLPFGLASAPRAFTKLLKPIVAVMRSKGIRIVIYLDDLLIMH